MAGQRNTKVKDDQNKKRKRDLSEKDSISKRQRAAQLSKLNGAQTEINGKNGTIVPIESKGDRELEVIRQFDNTEVGWRVSKPMGGRMLDIDPILTEDDQYLILSYNTSIQVFSAVDSLLVRRIPISTLDTSAPQGTAPAHIVATRLSKLNSDFLWVACSDGRVFYVDWTDSKATPRFFRTKSESARSMTTLTATVASQQQELVLVAESKKQSQIEVMMYQGSVDDKQEKRSLMTMKKPGNGLQLLETSRDSQILAGVFNDRLFIGAQSQQQINKFEDIQFDFYAFDTPDILTALDLRVYARSSATKKQRSNTTPVVDIVVGSANGAIYNYHDALARIQAMEKSDSEGEAMRAQKLHWHRKAVHAVKWSRDGNYLISGGSENVLVLWQMDTGKKDFLPHLSGSIENIVVSASGGSYAVHLDDNSTMVLSTAEMKPSAYVSGIQSAAANVETPKDLLVRRSWTIADSVQKPVPAAIRPTDTSKLHVCVGNGGQAALTGRCSAPLLQTFDLQTFTSISRQALARTQPTDVNMTNKGFLIEEPLVTHVQFSADGNWLASVDRWEPPRRDVANVSEGLKDHVIRERREIHLKFWDASQGEEQVALVSRINAPHTTTYPENVLDLAPHPSLPCFATLGSDGVIRMWRPKLRTQNGIPVKGVSGQEVYAWSCSQTIEVGALSQDIVTNSPGAASESEAQGGLAFSEDGSVLFVTFAYGVVESGAVYVIDTTSGKVVDVFSGLWGGRFHSIRALSPSIVVLSDELTVFNVVHGGDLNRVPIKESAKNSDLLQLAVDQTSGHFALVSPVGDGSTVSVYDPEQPEPLMVRNIPHRVVSLLSSPNSSGFIALDDAAQIWTVAEGSDPLSLATVQTLDDLRLEKGEDTESGKVTLMEVDEEMTSDNEEEPEQVQGAGLYMDVDMDDDDNHPVVLHQQQLTDIFDAAPTFAAASIEDMFYKVTGLLATKPLV